jgi:hypothetical protein
MTLTSTRRDNFWRDVNDLLHSWQLKPATLGELNSWGLGLTTRQVAALIALDRENAAGHPRTRSSGLSAMTAVPYGDAMRTVF